MVEFWRRYSGVSRNLDFEQFSVHDTSVKYGNVQSSSTDRKTDTDTKDREVHGG